MVSPFRWQSFCNFVGTRLMFISRSQLMHACFTSLQELRINLNWTFFQAKLNFITQGEGPGKFRQWKAVLTLGLPLQIKKWSITQFQIYLFSDNTQGFMPFVYRVRVNFLLIQLLKQWHFPYEKHFVRQVVYFALVSLTFPLF